MTDAREGLAQRQGLRAHEAADMNVTDAVAAIRALKGSQGTRQE